MKATCELNEPNDDKVHSNLNEENEDSGDELNEDDPFQDEFHDAVEDVCQFSVTLPRQNNNMILHHRNPSNISKLYLKESDSSEDEQDQYIKVGPFLEIRTQETSHAQNTFLN